MQSYTNNETTKLTGAAQAQSEKPSQAEDAAHGGAPGGATGQKPPLSPAEDDGIVSAAPIIPSFDEMGLPMPLLRGIYAYGFEKPSAIQQRAIKPLMDGRDTIAQAQSGTGKTAAFGIGAISRVDVDDPGTQAIILSPTRELAVQTNNVIKALGDYTGVTTHACVGGAPSDSTYLYVNAAGTRREPARLGNSLARPAMSARFGLITSTVYAAVEPCAAK